MILQGVLAVKGAGDLVILPKSVDASDDANQQDFLGRFDFQEAPSPVKGHLALAAFKPSHEAKEFGNCWPDVFGEPRDIFGTLQPNMFAWQVHGLHSPGAATWLHAVKRSHRHGPHTSGANER